MIITTVKNINPDKVPIIEPWKVTSELCQQNGSKVFKCLMEVRGVVKSYCGVVTLGTYSPLRMLSSLTVMPHANLRENIRI